MIQQQLLYRYNPPLSSIFNAILKKKMAASNAVYSATYSNAGRPSLRIYSAKDTPSIICYSCRTLLTMTANRFQYLSLLQTLKMGRSMSCVDGKTTGSMQPISSKLQNSRRHHGQGSWKERYKRMCMRKYREAMGNFKV